MEVEEGDVLLCKINPHLNRVWVVRHIMAQLKSLASSEWIVIRTDEIMPEYLALTMQSPYFRELMMSNVSGVGGSLMRAQPTFVKQYMKLEEVREAYSKISLSGLPLKFRIPTMMVKYHRSSLLVVLIHVANKLGVKLSAF